MNTENSGDRLRQYLHRKGVSPTECAEILGISTQALNNWFARGVPGRRIVSTAIALGLRPEWLESGATPSMLSFATGERVITTAESAPEPNAEMIGPIDVWDDATPLDSDEVYVPFLKEVELSAGGGRTVVEQSHKQKLRFGKLTLRKQGVQPENAVCVTVSGNSMDPVLPDKSTVGVDQGSTAVVDGKMYAIDHDGQLRVKTLYRLPGGGIRMRSFNRDEHPDEEYTAQDMADQNIHIKGKVFWSSVLW